MSEIGNTCATGQPPTGRITNRRDHESIIRITLFGDDQFESRHQGSICTCRGFRSVTVTVVSSPIISARGFRGMGSGRAFLRLTSVDLECCTRAFHLQIRV